MALEHLAGDLGMDGVGVVEEGRGDEGEAGVEEEPEGDEDEAVAFRCHSLRSPLTAEKFDSSSDQEECSDKRQTKQRKQQCA